MVTKGEGGSDKPGGWHYHIHITIYKTENQQKPTVQHRELHSILPNNL